MPTSMCYTVMNNQLVRSSSSKARYFNFHVQIGKTPFIKAALCKYSADFYGCFVSKSEPKIEQ